MHKQVCTSVESSVVGVKNGVAQIELDKKSLFNEGSSQNDFYKFYNTFSLWNEQEKAFSIKTLVIGAVKLKKAFLTDMMMFSPLIMPFNWVISEKFYSVLKQFDIGNHIVYEVKIEGANDKYFLLFKRHILIKELIIEECKTFTGHTITGNLKEYVFKTYKDYLKQDDKTPQMQFSKIAIDKKFECEDVIFLQASTKAFFSERLINALQEAGIKGMETKSMIKLEFV